MSEERPIASPTKVPSVLTFSQQRHPGGRRSQYVGQIIERSFVAQGHRCNIDIRPLVPLCRLPISAVRCGAPGRPHTKIQGAVPHEKDLTTVKQLHTLQERRMSIAIVVVILCPLQAQKRLPTLRTDSHSAKIEPDKVKLNKYLSFFLSMSAFQSTSSVHGTATTPRSCCRSQCRFAV